MPLANLMDSVTLQADGRSVSKEILVFLRSGYAFYFSHESVIVAYCKQFEFGLQAQTCNTILPFPNTCVFMTFSKKKST